MVGLKGLAAQLFSKQGLAKEFDPEADAPIDDEDGSQNGGSDSEQDVPEDTQDTDHYVQVGKSKLRQAQPIALGLAYRGKRVSRDQLNQSNEEEEDEDDEEDEEEDSEEEFDDPDTVDIEGAEEVNTDNEIDSDDALGDDDEELVEKFTFRGSAKPKTPKGKPVQSDEEEDDDEEEDEEMEDDDDEEEGGGSEKDSEEGSEEDSDSDSDSDSDDSDDSDDDSDVDATTAKAQAETRRLLAEDRQQVLNSLSQAAKADADKGFAVRTQRRTFDVLLNMRIRMQKALSVANSLYPLAIEATEGEGDEAKKTAPKAKDYEKAAEQAIELLQSIQSIRSSFYADGSASKSTKRARDTTCEDLYEQITAAEDVALAKRRKVIDRWSARVQRPSAGGGASSKSRFMSSSSQSQSVTSMLDGQLVAPDRLVRRTRTPRSCAPVQAAKRIEQDPEVFDDADFYQLLLKELVDQRTVDSSAGGGEAGSSAPTVRWAAQAAKEAKTRKQVDRKASKGRKMRFNVHEKLQNFMTAEDRRDWEPEAIDRFFSSLFGQRVELQEDDDSEDDEVAGGADMGEGLRLF